MKKIVPLLPLLLTVSLLPAQYNVQFILKEQTTIRHDSIYIVGTFNNWDSLSNKDYLMKPLDGNRKSITLNLGKGPIKYKFHRGSWLNVEKLYNSWEVADREVFISRDTVLVDSVQAWRDELFTDKKAALARRPNDSLAIEILASIARIYAFNLDEYNVDSAFHYVQKAIDLQQKSADANAMDSPASIRRLFLLKDIVATLVHSLGNYPKALEIRLENLGLAEKSPDKLAVPYALLALTDEYIAMGDYESALLYCQRAAKMLRSIGEDSPQKSQFTEWLPGRISESYYNLGKLDSALIYAAKQESLIRETGNLYRKAFNNLLSGDIYRAKGDLEAALKHYEKAIENAPGWLGPIVAKSKIGIAKIYQAQNQFGPALKYALAAIHYYQNNQTQVQSWGENTDTYIAEVSPLVAELYMKTGRPDSAYHFLQLSIALKDSLYNRDRIRQFQTLTFNETVRRQQLEQQKKEARQQFENRMKMYGLIAVLLAALVFAFFQIRNNKQKQKANNLLGEQKLALERTLQELKATQSQLIQSEKLASLGELTAGIAHEIQNPLNFVNNFSELSVDLVEELKEEIKKPEKDWELIEERMDDLFANQQKINQHGKRAAGIVSGMLQHSRASTGTKEPTDLNALADEYLRLAYHGLRAKDPTFNAKLETDFDPAVGKVDVIPQDIGRVFLNIINNAFYATQQRLAANVGRVSNPADVGVYEPTVSISSKKTENGVEFRIRDNGTGIPDDVKAKILQPFFTTKPTGQGTGLGLSISYDIVVKGHGGALEVETREGKGTAFIIKLPY